MAKHVVCGICTKEFGIREARDSIRTCLMDTADPDKRCGLSPFQNQNKTLITVLLSSAFLVWRWGLQGFGTHLSVALAIALLIFNAYLGARAWADLHQQNKVFLKYHIRNVPHIQPTEKFCRSTASPVWIERNAYYEEGRSEHHSL
ncbi:hypothetical protein ANCCAN_27312 [Ancylostoma caninum]|uniref:Uncharacterized protein n=1 Tax=Ancylostoma caninum TaxID=29170 RepID=A0A368F7Q9_ANCCA|nr:hypothetical protein ANCCAN_27312 [Ancylostoma caninum]